MAKLNWRPRKESSIAGATTKKVLLGQQDEEKAVEAAAWVEWGGS